jgi:hypothetical protein
VGVTLVSGEQASVVVKIAHELRLQAQFAQDGLSEAGGRSHAKGSRPRRRRPHRG